MINDALKLNIAPWQEKGRWYHIFIESNGTSLSVTTVDDDIVDSISNANITFKANFVPLNQVTKPHFVNTGKTFMSALCQGATNDRYLYTFTTGVAGNIDYADIWIFGYYEE